MKNPLAFPRTGYIDTSSGTLPDGDDVILHNDGMTLRDYFAGQAIIGLLASNREFRGQEGIDIAADRAFAFADAMLQLTK